MQASGLSSPIAHTAGSCRRPALQPEAVEQLSFLPSVTCSLIHPPAGFLLCSGVVRHLFRETVDSWARGALGSPLYQTTPSYQPSKGRQLGFILLTVLVTALQPQVRQGLYCCAPALPSDLKLVSTLYLRGRQGLSEGGQGRQMVPRSPQGVSEGRRKPCSANSCFRYSVVATPPTGRQPGSPETPPCGATRLGAFPVACPVLKPYGPNPYPRL